MKRLIGKIVVFIAGFFAFFGISTTNVNASIPDSNNKPALYLEHGKSIGSDTGNWQATHGSHVSHESHHSHTSGSR